MSNVETGVVESKRMDGKAIKVNGSWYSAYLPSELASVNRGDTVTVTWAPSKTGNFKNIKGVTTTAIAGVGTTNTTTVAATPPNKGKLLSVELDRDRCIIRQNALTNAVKLVAEWAGPLVGTDEAGKEDYVSTVIEIARAFEDYTSGDADIRAAKELIQ